MDNPRTIGEPLSGILSDFWKYRVGDYRIICDIQDNIITILVLAIGNRKQFIDAETTDKKCHYLVAADT